MTKSGKSKKEEPSISISATMKDIAIRHIFDPELTPAFLDAQLKSLLLSGYIYVAFAQYEVFDNLPEQQRIFINTLCDFVYHEEYSGGGIYCTPAAKEIYIGLISRRLSPNFTLSELKAFIIRNNIELRDDWKTRLELLESAGIESETTDITPGAGAGTSENKAPSSKRKMKVDTSGFFSIRALAERNNIPEYCYDKFSKGVLRWRGKNKLSPDYMKHDAPSKNQPRYLFKESAEAIQKIIKRCAK